METNQDHIDRAKRELAFDLAQLAEWGVVPTPHDLALLVGRIAR